MQPSKTALNDKNVQSIYRYDPYLHETAMAFEIEFDFRIKLKYEFETECEIEFEFEF